MKKVNKGFEKNFLVDSLRKRVFNLIDNILCILKFNNKLVLDYYGLENIDICVVNEDGELVREDYFSCYHRNLERKIAGNEKIRGFILYLDNGKKILFLKTNLIEVDKDLLYKLRDIFEYIIGEDIIEELSCGYKQQIYRYFYEIDKLNLKIRKLKKTNIFVKQVENTLSGYFNPS